MSTLSLFADAARPVGGSAAAASVPAIEEAAEARGEDAAGAEPTAIGIYYITLGISTYRWLCARHVAARNAAGWACKRTGNVEFECDDCAKERNEQG